MASHKINRCWYLCLISMAILAIGPTHGFVVPSLLPKLATYTTTTTSSSLSMSSTMNKPDLVDQKTFVAAIQRIEDEIFSLEIQQQIQEAEANGEQPPNVEEQQQQRQSSINPDVVLAIGRLHVELPIDTQPELDLTESAGPLVLVTGVWGRTAEETGLQVYDTIVSVSVGGNMNDPNQQQQEEAPTFSAYTKGQTLDQTAAVLTAAAQHALQAGGTRITLEVNRLIQGFYASEEEEQAAIQDAQDAFQQQQQQQQDQQQFGQ